MEIGVDFFSWLDSDTITRILMCLEDPSDLVRVSSVSRSWRHFVIENGLCKQLCLRMFPCFNRVDHVVETIIGPENSSEVGCSKSVEWETLQREHRVFAFLARGCTSFALRECISDAISASSTDNYPEESIHNTLEPGDRIARRPSYWSSKGQSNPTVPETLTYKLVADICVITEISIQPFQAFFQIGSPIYSAKSVRFRMGHVKAPVDDPMGEAYDNFVWTYISPEFPMDQVNRLQKFQLPEPVLCIGGVLQVELLGRIQRQEMDGLFYICVSHVQVMGRPLSPSFGIEILEPSGKFVLKAQSYTPPGLPENEPRPYPNSYFEGRVRDLEQIVNLLRGQGVVVEDDWGHGVVVEEDDWNEGDDELFEEDMAL